MRACACRDLKKGCGAMELGKPGIGARALPFHVYLSASSARLEGPGLVEKNE